MLNSIYSILGIYASFKKYEHIYQALLGDNTSNDKNC